VGAVPGDRPAVPGAGYWKQWLRLAVAVGWLLHAAAVWYVPKPRRPAGELPAWKLVVWFILFFIGASVMAFIWRGR
jgi:hypothetical protein